MARRYFSGRRFADRMIETRAQSDQTCKDCGGCCDGTWPVETTPEDQRREPRIALNALDEFPLPDGWLTIAAPGTPCSFVSSAGCDIYDTRPACCRRVMQGSSPECKSSRKRLGLELIQIGVS